MNNIVKNPYVPMPATAEGKNKWATHPNRIIRRLFKQPDTNPADKWGNFFLAVLWFTPMSYTAGLWALIEFSPPMSAGEWIIQLIWMLLTAVFGWRVIENMRKT